MRKLFYMGLEPYQGRYTLQLQTWSEETFKRRGIDYVVVPGETLDNNKAIVTGQVLDAHGRSYFSLSQMMNLTKMMKNGDVTRNDVIFFEDMFTPGIEALPYIMNQVDPAFRPKVFVRCLAQTIDPDDFLHVWGMESWMAKYEKMVGEFATVLASSEEMVAHMKIAGWKAPIYNISGLTFSKDEVRKRFTYIKPFKDRSYRVAFASRWDQEKQPRFYMDLVKRIGENYKNVEFVLLAGGPLRSNRPEFVEEARQLEKTHNFKIHENLTKDDYYNILADSRVLFNCALQDWISNTVSEADALGTNVLFPAYRSFPEVFSNDHERMYVPWSLEDASFKLIRLLKYEHASVGKISDWTDKTVDRMIDIMQGTGEKWRRNSNTYRDYVSEEKYKD